MKITTKTLSHAKLVELCDTFIERIMPNEKERVLLVAYSSDLSGQIQDLLAEMAQIEAQLKKRLSIKKHTDLSNLYGALASRCAKKIKKYNAVCAECEARWGNANKG